MTAAAHEIFAYVHDNKVKQLGCFLPGSASLADYICHATYGEDSYAVEVTSYPVQEGDECIDGVFYGLRVNPETGDLERIAILPTPDFEGRLITLESGNQGSSDAIDDILVYLFGGDDYDNSDIHV